MGFVCMRREEETKRRARGLRVSGPQSLPHSDTLACARHHRQHHPPFPSIYVSLCLLNSYLWCTEGGRKVEEETRESSSTGTLERRRSVTSNSQTSHSQRQEEEEFLGWLCFSFPSPICFLVVSYPMHSPGTKRRKISALSLSLSPSSFLLSPPSSLRDCLFILVSETTACLVCQLCLFFSRGGKSSRERRFGGSR